MRWQRSLLNMLSRADRCTREILERDLPAKAPAGRVAAAVKLKRPRFQLELR